MVVTIEYMGGPTDGRRLSSDSEDSREADEAMGMYHLTHEGEVGRRFRTVSDAGVHAIVAEGDEDLTARGIKMNDIYEVVERIADGEGVLVRIEYIGRED